MLAPSNSPREGTRHESVQASPQSGKTVVGTAGAPNVDNALLADAGFDFLLFDTQHSPGS
jgi:2-keto-3-deoxy-L-rhamnonate aldolase RhmA